VLILNEVFNGRWHSCAARHPLILASAMSARRLMAAVLAQVQAVAYMPSWRADRDRGRWAEFVAALCRYPSPYSSANVHV